MSCEVRSDPEHGAGQLAGSPAGGTGPTGTLQRGVHRLETSATFLPLFCDTNFTTCLLWTRKHECRLERVSDSHASRHRHLLPRAMLIRTGSCPAAERNRRPPPATSSQRQRVPATPPSTWAGRGPPARQRTWARIGLKVPTRAHYKSRVNEAVISRPC